MKRKGKLVLIILVMVVIFLCISFNEKISFRNLQDSVVEALCDTQSPTAPANLVSTAESSTSVTLSWMGPKDNTDITEYDVYNGQTLAGRVSGTSYIVTELSPQTAYSFCVKARNAAGNISVPSNTISVTTLAGSAQMLFNPSFDSNDSGWRFYTDSTAQIKKGRDTDVYDSVPASCRIECVKTGGTLGSIQMYTTSGINIVKNEVYRLTFRAKCTSDINIPSVSLHKNASPWTNYAPNKTGLSVTQIWQSYSIDFAANTTASEARIDFGLGNVLPVGTVLYIDTLSLNRIDNQAPKAPRSLTCTSKTETSAVLSWKASTDDSGVIAYDVYSGVTKVASVTGTSNTVTELTANTTYSFSVKARDAVGNISAASNAISVITGTGEMLYNPSFDSDDSGWAFYTDSTARINKGIDSNAYDSFPSSCRIECLKTGGTLGSIQMYTSSGMSITKNKVYRLTFRAKCTSNINIPRISIQKSASPWTNYAHYKAKLPITQTWQSYSIDFTANTTASDTRIDFGLGNGLPVGAVLNIDTLSFKELS